MLPQHYGGTLYTGKLVLLHSYVRFTNYKLHGCGLVVVIVHPVMNLIKELSIEKVDLPPWYWFKLVIVVSILINDHANQIHMLYRHNVLLMTTVGRVCALLDDIIKL